MRALQPTISTITPHHDMVRSLRQLQRQGFVHSLIAGGAIRDMYFQRPIKDIDIFLWDPDVKGNTEKNLTAGIGINEKSITKLMDLDVNQSWYRRDFATRSGLGEDEEYAVTKHVTQVWSVVKNEIPYQLIFLNIKPLEFVENHFDLAICKAYCDGYKIRYTKDFSIDAQRQTLTICSHGLTQRHFDYILETYLPRIKEKYPSFVPKVASHNAKFVDDKNIHLL